MGIFTRSGAATPVAAAQTQPLAELAPGLNLARFYTENTGCTPDPNYFGVYAVEAIGGSLYLGLGTARPAESNGALVARFNGKELKAVSRLDEQGFVCMRSDKNTLYIPGADPTEDWTLEHIHRRGPRPRRRCPGGRETPQHEERAPHVGHLPTG